ncbi:MAG: hypothetical protein QXM46_01945 [Candidatus Hadarchaeales archaeon]
MRKVVLLPLLLLPLLLGGWWFLREEGPGFRFLGHSLVAGENLELELFYSTHRCVQVTLFGPEGEKLDQLSLPENASSASLLLSPKGSSPRGGTYRLVFEYRGRKVVENLLSFSGPRVEVGEVSFGWRGESWPWENLLREVQRLYPGEDPERKLEEFIEGLLENYPWADREKMLENHCFNFYELRSVRVELLNSGDLPAYVLAVKWRLENTEVGGRYVAEWLLPGKREWEWESSFYSLPGKRSLTVTVLEGWDRVLAENTRLLPVP